MESFDLAQYITELKAWQLATFGTGERTQALIKHIRKELREIEQNPGDLMEWVDVMILAIEGAWRSGGKVAEWQANLVNVVYIPMSAGLTARSMKWTLGAFERGVYSGDVWYEMFEYAVHGAMSQNFTLAQIQQALVEKLEINKARQWPEPIDGEPVEHVRQM